MIIDRESYKRHLAADRKAAASSRRQPLPMQLDPTWRFLRALRAAEYHRNTARSPLGRALAAVAWLRYYRLRVKYGLEIPLNTVGPGLCIPHVGPIVIHRDARIGANARIGIGVVVGMNRGPHEVPELGDDIVLEPGSKVFGGIRLANGTHVGANAVVNRSVLTENEIVVGVPARPVAAADLVTECSDPVD